MVPMVLAQYVDSRNHFLEATWNEMAEMLSALSAFLIVRPGFRLFCARLAVEYFACLFGLCDLPEPNFQYQASLLKKLF